MLSVCSLCRVVSRDNHTAGSMKDGNEMASDFGNEELVGALGGTDAEPSLVAFELSINGLAVFSISASLDDALATASVTLEVPLREIESLSRRYNSNYELLFVLTAPPSTWGAPLPPRNLFAYVQCPWGMKHYLGPIPVKEESIPSARLVRAVPSVVEVVVCADTCIPTTMSPPWPCEMLLKEHIKVILENDEFCGSVSSSHMQNLVRELPFYAPAMRRRKRWPDLVGLFAQQYRCWSLVSYSAEEHKAVGLSDLTPVNEVRLVANRFLRSYQAGDKERDRVKLAALLEYRQLVLPTALSMPEEECDGGAADPTCAVPLSKEHIQRLAMSHSFLTLNCINYLQVLKQASEHCCVLFSSLHPIQLDEASNTAMLSEAFRFGQKKRVC